MATIHRFEDLECWKKAAELYQLVTALTEKPPFRNSFHLKDQIERSSESVMANIAEGFNRRGDKEFHRFLAIAKASSAETRSHAHAAHVKKLISNDELTRLANIEEEAEKLISGLMRYLRDSNKGPTLPK